jgi:hypothetical protein
MNFRWMVFGFHLRRPRVFVRLASAAFVIALLTGGLQPAAAQSEDPRFFPQTSYRVDTDAFWTFFRHAAVFGRLVIQSRALSHWTDSQSRSFNGLSCNASPTAQSRR